MSEDTTNLRFGDSVLGDSVKPHEEGVREYYCSSPIELFNYYCPYSEKVINSENDTIRLVNDNGFVNEIRKLCGDNNSDQISEDIFMTETYCYIAACACQKYMKENCQTEKDSKRECKQIFEYKEEVLYLTDGNRTLTEYSKEGWRLHAFSKVVIGNRIVKTYIFERPIQLQNKT